jgi:3-methyladenine DNA glycosylase AlkD
MKYPAESLMRKWNKSEDIWLVRASIQHQRGRKYETDVDLLFGLCAPHVAKKEFFIAKAIGWALRDLSRIDNREVIRFLNEHPDLNSVAVREAKKLTR